MTMHNPCYLLFRWLPAIFLLASSPLYWAESEAQWRKVSVALYSQSQGDLKQAAYTGLQRVVMRLSGQRPAMEVLRKQVAAPLKLLEQYGYTEGAAPEFQQFFNVPSYRVTLIFNLERLRSLAQDLGLPVMPKVRPRVLLWVNYPGPQGERMLLVGDPAAKGTGGDLLQLTQSLGQQLGLDFDLPPPEAMKHARAVERLHWSRMNDLSQVWGYDDILLVNLTRDEASAIVQPEVETDKDLDTQSLGVGLANVTAVPRAVGELADKGVWTGDYAHGVLGGEYGVYESLSGEFGRQVYGDILFLAAQQWVRKYAYFPEGEHDLFVEVGNVNGGLDYALVLAHLKNMGGVRRVQTVRLARESVLFKVYSQSDPDYMLRILGMHREFSDIRYDKRIFLTWVR